MGTTDGMAPQGGRSAITRRVALGLMGAGALSVASLALGGCSMLPGARVALAERLLKEKYDREFKVVRKAYGFEWNSQPIAECRALKDVDGPVFIMSFDVANEVLISDTFAER
ncbi:MAG: hypothetical protein LBH87_02185, partial [Coriobacteriales bacterium]|nr:hypothetical protein [Coriobacteriales bacterium]